MKKVIMGNHAVSYGVMLSRVEVIAAYPITPQTQVVEELSELCASGKMRAKFINIESEHSALASLITACMYGCRVFTATSSQGLALMHELLHWTSSARLPIVMVNVNRAFAPGWNIWVDQTDSLSQRDTGWIQMYCDSNQEILDTIIQAYRIAEKVKLPCMVAYDAFFQSHTYEPVDIPEIGEVDRFLPEYNPEYKIDVDNPCSFNNLLTSDYFMDFKAKTQKAMVEAKDVIKDVDVEFSKLFGRSYGVIAEHCCDDAEIIVIASSTIASTARTVIKNYREKGLKVGLLKIRLFRPFPKEDIKKAIKYAKKVAVIDRNISIGSGGIFAQEVKLSMLNEDEKPLIFSFICGLGGGNVTPKLIEEMVNWTIGNDKPSDESIFIK